MLNRTIRPLAIAVIGCVITVVAAVYAMEQALQNKVTDRTNSMVTRNGTDAMALDSRIAGSAAGPMRSLLALISINQALEAYPVGFLRDHGPDILLSNKLTLSGYPVAGTAQYNGDRGAVILSTSYLLPSLNLAYLRRTFHHEYSSLLIAGNEFPKHQWTMALPQGFFYPTTEKEQLEATQSYATTTELSDMIAMGFVSDYGMSSMENDINTYAELLFTEPDQLTKWARESPLVEIKTNLIVQFYAGLDSGFTDNIIKAGLKNFLDSSGR